MSDEIALTLAVGVSFALVVLMGVWMANRMGESEPARRDADQQRADRRPATSAAPDRIEVAISEPPFPGASIVAGQNVAALIRVGDEMVGLRMLAADVDNVGEVLPVLLRALEETHPEFGQAELVTLEMLALSAVRRVDERRANQRCCGM